MSDTQVPAGLVSTFKRAWETANLDPALEGQRTKTALTEVLAALPDHGWTPPTEPMMCSYCGSENARGIDLDNDSICDDCAEPEEMLTIRLPKSSWLGIVNGIEHWAERPEEDIQILSDYEIVGRKPIRTSTEEPK